MSPSHANDADELVTSDDPLHVNEPHFGNIVAPR